MKVNAARRTLNVLTYRHSVDVTLVASEGLSARGCADIPKLRKERVRGGESGGGHACKQAKIFTTEPNSC